MITHNESCRPTESPSTRYDPTMPDLDAGPTPEPTPALALVHEGWNHLKRQRPLAAWASWRRALRFEPEHKAATHALDVLANAPDLPDAARADYRFLTPVDNAQRDRWDRELRSRDLGDLAIAAEAFGRLADSTEHSPKGDGRARFNQGLCLAWIGRNSDAVLALDRAVGSLAEAEPGVAVDAWTLAEVVRQGGGAEALADDLNHVATLIWTENHYDPAGFLEARPDVRPVPTPLDPTSGLPTRPDIQIFEWLDRPDSQLGDGPSGEIRRILATAIRSSGSLRLSGPDPTLLEQAVAEAVRACGPWVTSVRREAGPLPLAFLDAAVWAIRFPVGTDPEAADELNRSSVERYYETTWINRPRLGLDGHSPVEAGRLASGGDLVLQAKLEAVVRVREQLGARPSTALLYQGYPFDRLRRRVGLTPTNPEAVDPLDASSMSAADLDQLDPKTLGDFALLDAFESAAALGEDSRTARFASWLADLDVSTSVQALRRVDLSAVFATLVRQALAEDDVDLALEWVDRAIAVESAVHGGRDAEKFTTWRAEVQARAGRPDASLLTYRQIIEARPDAELALDAAETLLDNGHDDQARTLAQVALELARQAGNEALADRAEAML